MKLNNINITETLENAKQALKDDKNISSSTKSAFQLLILIIALFVEKFNLNSTNSSKPPSSDPGRMKSGRLRPCEFRLTEKDVEPKSLELGRFYVCLKNDQIHYQCFNPVGTITKSIITKKDLPATVVFPKKTNLLCLIKSVSKSSS